MRIEDMSIDQLLELNQYVCRRIDELRDQENLQALSQLRVGLKVTFEGREGPVLGIVTKINRKVSVHSTTFCHPAKIRPKVTSQFPSEVTPMRKHRTPEQWQALINQQRDSGLSASKFCKQENIGYASFCNWRKRLSDQAAGDSADSGEAGFLDLSSLMGAAQSGPGWNIVLSLGNGVELRLSQNG